MSKALCRMGCPRVLTIWRNIRQRLRLKRVPSVDTLLSLSVTEWPWVIIHLRLTICDFLSELDVISLFILVPFYLGLAVPASPRIEIKIAYCLGDWVAIRKLILAPMKLDYN